VAVAPVEAAGHAAIVAIVAAAEAPAAIAAVSVGATMLERAAPVEEWVAAREPADQGIADMDRAVARDRAAAREWVVVRAAPVEADRAEEVEAEVAEATDNYRRRQATRGGSDALSVPFAL
jgi:hypothetical protein